MSIPAGRSLLAQTVRASKFSRAEMVSRDLCFYPVGVTLDLTDATIPLCLRMANRLELMRMRVEEGLGRMLWSAEG